MLPLPVLLLLPAKSMDDLRLASGMRGFASANSRCIVRNNSKGGARQESGAQLLLAISDSLFVLFSRIAG